MYLRHVVSGSGVKTDLQKVDAVLNYAAPVDVKSLRSFLTSYCRRFIPGFSQVAGPLHALTKKDALLEWGPQCQEKLKELLMSSPVLVFLDFKRWFILETDAFGA